MAVITPNTDVILLKVPLEISDSNQLTFANATAQYNYFYGLSNKIELDNYTYQRKDNTIRVGMLADDLYDYNYVMYRNANHDNKWYYAFIIGVDYINDSVSAVKIKTDVWQTYQFELTYKPVFVEREHVNDDTIGLHTLPESLELGDLVQNTSSTFEPNKTVWTSGHSEQLVNKRMIVFQVTELPEGSYGIANPHAYNGIYSGLFFLGVKSTTDATNLIQKYASSTVKTDAIVSIFMAPTAFFDNASFSNISTSGGNVTVYYPVDDSLASNMSDNAYTLSMPLALNGYTPKNNKLFTYPYSYLTIDNNAGVCITERYENFVTPSSPSFYMGGSLGQGCSIKLCPIGYKGQDSTAENYEEGISAMKLPVCGWASDYYTNWLTQNALNIPLTIGKIGAGLGLTAAAISAGVVTGGAATIAGASAGVNAATQIGNLIAERREASLVPDQAHGNTNLSDCNIGFQKFFTVKCMSIKSEYAKIIDDYFSAYGYSVNTIKLPNITGRTNWNYVKTVGCYIQADIPQEDLAEIKSMFDNGITFWHNPATFADYSQSNGIVV